jgi:hypothetical protein
MILSNLITLNSRLDTAAAAIVHKMITRSKARVFLPVLPSKKTSVVAPAIMDGVGAPLSLRQGKGALKLDGERDTTGLLDRSQRSDHVTWRKEALSGAELADTAKLGRDQ